MSIPNTIQDAMLEADAKALATTGPAGLNVVPVSMIRIVDNEIWLFDFFMGKTAENLRDNPRVSLTCWTGMKGIQLWAECTYIDDVNELTEAIEWVKGQNPSRVVRGLLVLKPLECFDVSPGGAFAEEDLSVVAWS